MTTALSHAPLRRAVPALVVSGALGATGAWAIVTNAYPAEGPWMPLYGDHGIHVGDVVIVGAWALISYGLLRWTWAACTAQ